VKLEEHKRIQMISMPGHMAIHGNETDDKLAPHIKNS
jgi:hypothetical protein